MKILVLDNNIDQDCWGSSDIVNHCLPYGQTSVRRPPHNDLPSLKYTEQFDAIVISGSKTSCLDQSDWVLKLDEWLRIQISRKIPMLGICYGHQSLIRVLSGKFFNQHLRKGNVPEYGWTKINHDQKNKLLSGLDQTFYSFSVHYEEVFSLPEGCRNTAHSPDCSIQSFEHDTLPLFGVQFHPEKTLVDCEKSLLNALKRGEPKNLLEPKSSQVRYNSDIGKKIFSNFIQSAF